jgi:5-formyltetrahydrofolate cyclo-ligase
MREQKNSVRQILRQKKDAMIPEDRLLKSHRICHHLREIITDGETGNPVVVPIIVKEDVSLRLSYLRDFSKLVPSTFGVPEPIGSEIPAAAKDIGTIILPMLGFDRKGGRIGYGAGYYDRFLSKTSNLRKIGVAFACQEVDYLPVDEHDIRMDYIITENGIVYPDGG